MQTNIVMPVLGVEIEEGQMISWSKTVGEQVTEGELIGIIGTPKLNMDLEAPAGGTLIEIRVAPDEIASVGAVLAVLETMD